MSVEEIDTLLNQRSGLAGLCGTNDMREVLRRRSAGDVAAGAAFGVYCRRVREYVGAYYAVLGRLDAVTFTAGVGEHAGPVREAVLAGLEGIGIMVDAARNHHGPAERLISPPGARVAVCVVPTDEEREIADQARSVVTMA